MKTMISRNKFLLLSIAFSFLFTVSSFATFSTAYGVPSVNNSDASLVPYHHVITLTSPNVQSNGYFGYSVAAGAKFAIIGAAGEVPEHAYVYSAATGALMHTLTSPNPQQHAAFGA